MWVGSVKENFPKAKIMVFMRIQIELMSNVLFINYCKSYDDLTNVKSIWEDKSMQCNEQILG